MSELQELVKEARRLREDIHEIQERMAIDQRNLDKLRYDLDAVNVKMDGMA